MTNEATTSAVETVTIEKLIYGGDGLARLSSGQVVFVPWSIPGETLEINIQPGSKPLRGIPARIIATSQQRQTPPCSVFGRCGGCQWQMFPAEFQREWKQKIVQETLTRLGKLDVTVQPTLGSDETAWHYRNRVQWVLEPDTTQGLRLGYYAAGSREVIAFEHCWIMPEHLNHIANWLQANLTPETAKKIQRIEAQTNAQGEVLLVFDTQAKSGWEDLLEQLTTEFDCLTGAVFTSGLLWGEDHLIHEIAGHQFKCSYESFFQTNFNGLEQMLSIIEGWLPEKTDSLLDLYAGVGLFATCFSNRAGSVTAVESLSSALEDAKENLRLNQSLNVQVLEGDVRQVLGKMDESFEMAILDPPRAGCHPQVLDWLSEHVQQQLVYVSCDPTTLARDLRKLVDAGWRVEAVQPLDMFPQTYHVETLVLLRK